MFSRVFTRLTATGAVAGALLLPSTVSHAGPRGPQPEFFTPVVAAGPDLALPTALPAAPLSGPGGTPDQAAGTTVDLTVTADGTPQRGKFFEDIGHFRLRGKVSTQRAGTKIEVYWNRVGTPEWHKSGTVTTASDGSFVLDQLVGYAATFQFRATLGGAPNAPQAIASTSARATVLNSFVKANKPVSAIDALKNPTISGSVYPARRGVKVQVQVLRKDRVYRTAASTLTDAAGRYRVELDYGHARPGTMTVRTVYPASNRPRVEASTAHKIARTKVLNASVTRTKPAEVAKTYRSGCPVGPSKLRTIRMNYYGYDGRMHRGVMIVRSSLTGEITRSFDEALEKGFRIAKMRNPNDYNGNDKTQMAANNTSGFNCRKVVGNPYAQSPHSYGIAIDVNTVQNPYRDRNGKWWPSNGRPYIDRTPLGRGMLGYRTSLTAQLRNEGYFWGGQWSPGKDYQHFEYNK